MEIDKLYEQFQLDNKQDGFVPTSKYIFGNAYLKGKEARQSELEQEKQKLEWILAQVEQQAASWKLEAKTQKSTVHKIYQLVTGAKGEPGDWNGANPVRDLITRQSELEGIVGELGRHIEKMDDDLADASLDMSAARLELSDMDGPLTRIIQEFISANRDTLTRAQKMLEG